MKQLDDYWVRLAQQLMAREGVETRVSIKYMRRFAHRLRDWTEDYIRYDIPDMEREAKQSETDKHWQQKIDEARGK